MVSALKVGWKQGWLGGSVDTSKDVIMDDGTCVMNNACRGLGTCSLKCERMWVCAKEDVQEIGQNQGKDGQLYKQLQECKKPRECGWLNGY